MLKPGTQVPGIKQTQAPESRSDGTRRPVNRVPMNRLTPAIAPRFRIRPPRNLGLASQASACRRSATESEVSTTSATCSARELRITRSGTRQEFRPMTQPYRKSWQLPLQASLASAAQDAQPPPQFQRVAKRRHAKAWDASPGIKQTQAPESRSDGTRRPVKSCSNQSLNTYHRSAIPQSPTA